MTSAKKKTTEHLITVDAVKLSCGLKTTFEGVTMVFDSLGIDDGFESGLDGGFHVGFDAGFDATEKEENGTGKKKASKALATDVPVKPGHAGQGEQTVQMDRPVRPGHSGQKNQPAQMNQEVEEAKNEAEDAAADAAADTAGDDTAPDGVSAPDDAAVEPVPDANGSDATDEAQQKKSGASTSGVSQDDITKIIVQKIKKNRSNNEKIGQLLKTYGAARVRDLPEDKYEAFLTDLAAL